MITRPKKGWDVLLKEFLIKAFTERMDDIVNNKEHFIDIVQQNFPGTRMTPELLNCYLCRFRKGQLVLKDRKPRVCINKPNTKGNIIRKALYGEALHDEPES